MRGTQQSLTLGKTQHTHEVRSATLRGVALSPGAVGATALTVVVAHSIRMLIRGMSLALWACGVSVNPSRHKSSSPARGSVQSVQRPKLHLLDLCEQLIVSAMPVMDKIPRIQRYRYGSMLESALFSLPDLIIQAASAGTKTKVYALDDRIELLNSLLRVGAERRLISARFVGHIMSPPNGVMPMGGLMRQIGAICASWRSSLKA